MPAVSTVRRVLQGLAAFSLCALSLTAAAQSWPAKPVRMIVPFVAGGATDVVARQLAAHLQQTLGQRFIIENRTGANGNIGADFVAKSPADGYTILVADLGTFTSGPAVSPNLPFDPLSDFAPITMLVGSPYGLAVNPALPANNVREMLAFAKANPDKSDVKKRFGEQGAEVATGTPEELARFVADERAKFARLVKEHNIKVE